jgi:hypothetical protein
MSPLARRLALGPGPLALALAAACGLPACAGDTSPVAITAEPRPAKAELPRETPAPRPPAPAPHAQGARADTFTIEYAPLQFKIAIAVPEGGTLCIILPQSAQDPTACVGVDTSAMVDALPQGAERPFGVAYARLGEWSYFVMLSPLAQRIDEREIATREDIEEFVGGAEKGVREATQLAPKLIVDTPNQRFDLLRVKDVPVVKFRIDVPQPPDSPRYDLASTLYYAAFGGKAAMVSFLTSPKDMDRLMPYAEATVQSLVLPAREAPERFGKPRAEIGQQNTRLAISILGPLVAIGILLFWWLSRGKKAEPGA